MRTSDNSEHPDAPKSIGGHMVRGAAWMVSMRWSLKAIGVVNTVIIARLLAPDDFGIIAMAMIIVGFLTDFTDTNVEIAIIRKADATRQDYDSAWTIKIITGALVAAALIGLAPFAAEFYDDIRVETVIQIIALRGLINGFENIGVADFRKKLQFTKEYRYWIFRRLTDIVITLSIVFALRDYYALAISFVVSASVTVTYSYLMSPYRPRFCLAKVRELWSVSQWLMIEEGSNFVGRRIDEFIIGGVAGSSTVGYYYMASEISAMPTREVVNPAGRALMPTFAKVAHDDKQSTAAFLAVFGLIAIYALPAGIGVSVVAGDLVPLLLGAQWGAVIPFFQWLGVFAAFEALVWGVKPYFFARGGERAYALAYFGYVSILVPAIVFAAMNFGIMAVAMTRTGVMVLFVVAMMFIVSRMGYARLTELISALWRPAIASAVMWIGIHAAPRLDIDWHAVALARDVAIGAALYAATVLALWVLAGRPAGAERSILGAISHRLSG